MIHRPSALLSLPRDRVERRYFPILCLTRRRLKGLLWLVSATMLIVATISGCSPLYVLRAAYEEGKILWRREPIVDFVQKSDVAPDTQEKLQLVLAVRDYARNVLKFNVGGSYSSFSYVDRPDLTYVVVAAPKTELRPYTWWFLIVGRVPYKGYFSKEEAQAEIDRLSAEGYDTYLRTSAAFSTLGWFDDPLLSHLLRFNKTTLAEVVFHELFHNTLYINGAGAFNESSANFVGHHAAMDFFRARLGENSPEYLNAVQSWSDEREFGGFIAELARTLNDLYGRDIPRADKLPLREEIFNRSKAEWLRRIADRPNHRFRAFSQRPLNNAVLMHYIVYLKDIDLFEALYNSSGRDLVRTVDALRRAVAGGKEPFEALRAWLDKHGTQQAAAVR
jgi:predicted aminopeptidase